MEENIDKKISLKLRLLIGWVVGILLIISVLINLTENIIVSFLAFLLMVLIFPPAVKYLKNKIGERFSVKNRIILILIILISVVFTSPNESIIDLKKQDNINKIDNSETKDLNEVVDIVQKNETVKNIEYSTIEKWDLPNNGIGKKILISRDYLNADDIKLLGDKLKKDHSGYSAVNIWVYTDIKAAQLRDKILSGEYTQAEDLLHEQNFVGWYKKNPNNGLHEFDTFINGPTSEHNTIKF